MRDLFDSFLLTNDPVDLERAWHGGLVDRPASGEDCGERKTPVLLHLHGAFGLGECEATLIEICRTVGIALVAPDSFARRNRVSNCFSGSIETGGFPLADLYRRCELLYAYRALLREDWVDGDRIALSGFSEGAAAVSVWGSHVPCCAALITSWSCSAPSSCDWVDGLRLPAHVPVLQALSAHDPWFDREGWRPSKDLARDEFRQLIVPNTDLHDVYRLDEVQYAYRTFLERYVSQVPTATGNFE